MLRMRPQREQHPLMRHSGEVFRDVGLKRRIQRNRRDAEDILQVAGCRGVCKLEVHVHCHVTCYLPVVHLVRVALAWRWVKIGCQVPRLQNIDLNCYTGCCVLDIRYK